MTAAASDLSSQLDSARTPTPATARERRLVNTRRDRARRNLAVHAVEHGWDAERLAETIDMLGLRPCDDLEELEEAADGDRA